MGMNRNATPSTSAGVISNQEKQARFTTYSLFGFGCQDNSRVGNSCLKKMLDMSVLLMMLYGLEALVITSKENQVTEASFRKMLKRIQTLSPRIANEASYILVGELPA